MSDFRLTDSDKATPLWIALRAHLEQRLEQHRSRNDTDLNPEQTAKLRGQIMELRALLALESPRPRVPAD